MDKLVISVNTKKALDDFKHRAKVNGYDALERFIERGNDPFKHDLKPLNPFTPEQFALLLCGWYEVEQPFKAGDWITCFNNMRTAPIDERGVDDAQAWVDDDEVNFFVNYRHATAEEIAQEKERRKWAEIGREVGDYRKGDIVSTGSIIRVVVGTQNDSIFLEGMPFTNDYTADELFMVCPVEKRFDQ